MTIAAHPRLLTISETARRLRVSDVTVRRLIRRGELSAVQLGGKGSAVRIPVDELDAWLYGDGPRDAA